MTVEILFILHVVNGIHSIITRVRIQKLSYIALIKYGHL